MVAGSEFGFLAARQRNRVIFEFVNLDLRFGFSFGAFTTRAIASQRSRINH